MSWRLQFAAWWSRVRCRRPSCECCSKRIRGPIETTEDGYFCMPCVASLLGEQVRVYRELIDEYVDHGSWRCAHPDRYSQAENCPCGLLVALENAGIEPEPWRRTEQAG